MENFIIKDIEQIRLLSDPFKLQLIQAFAEGDKTTKQVAADLGESVTKLYRHVDALHGAGLLVITGEKQSAERLNGLSGQWPNVSKPITRYLPMTTTKRAPTRHGTCCVWSKVKYWTPSHTTADSLRKSRYLCGCAAKRRRRALSNYGSR